MRVMTLGQLRGLRGPDDPAATWVPPSRTEVFLSVINPVVPLEPRRSPDPESGAEQVYGEGFWRFDRPRAYVAAGILGLAAYGAFALFRR